MGKLIDLTSKKFGRLQVVARSSNNKHNAVVWKCVCDCGNEVFVTGGNLKSGNSRSCGCEKREVNAVLRTTHGEAYTRLYKIYRGIRNRCYNKNVRGYDNYGGRGIIVCDEWLDNYEVFREWALSNGYSDNLTIERRNNDGNYEPDNCRWATYAEQAKNKRNIVYLEKDGVRRTMREWSEIIGISYNNILSRRHKGWSDEKILTTPLRHY